MAGGVTSAAAMVRLTDRVTPFTTEGTHVVAAGFLADRPVLILTNGTALIGTPDEARSVTLAAGDCLVAVADAQRFITGHDSGRVAVLEADGTARVVADEQGKWIDALAPGPDGSLAWSAGRTVRARTRKGEVKSFAAPSTARGLHFMPKGYRLAIAHYDGVSLWFPNLGSPPEPLAWKGSHIDVTASPDGRFVVTSMQENALHGWRTADKAHMRMTGYPAKTRSLSWSHDGNWLATSGAEACIIWPFAAKDGPMGKAPRECGVRPRRVTAVAFHPAALIVALGYEDGFVMLVRLTDAAELLVCPAAESDGAVTALAWDASGRRLLFGTAAGTAGLLTLP